MPHYSYIAKSLHGEKKKGVKYAENKRNLARALRKEDYILVSATSKEKKKKAFSLNVISKIRGVSLKEKLMFTRNLKVMIGAGTPLPRALNTLASQTRSAKMKEILEEIATKITKGKRFSEVLSEYPEVFSELYRSMIEVGEETGELVKVLDNLAFQMKRSHELRSEVKGAMIYPAVIIAAMVGIGILMLVMVVPRLAETFKELDIALPPSTRFVMGLGSFLSNNFLLGVLIIVGLVVLIKVILSTKNGQKMKDTLFLKIPIISTIVVKTNSAATARTLSILISSGVPMVKSLKILSRSLGNFYFQEAMKDAAKEVKKGRKISETLSSHEDIYPTLVIEMLKVGEETGETTEVLQKLADFFEEEVTRTTKNLTSIIEPVLMIIIGAAVGFFAISMIRPMYSMLGSL